MLRSLRKQSPSAKSRPGRWIVEKDGDGVSSTSTLLWIDPVSYTHLGDQLGKRWRNVFARGAAFSAVAGEDIDIIAGGAEPAGELALGDALLPNNLI